MADNLLFSIIVPIYKVEKYLRQCVDSLLKQNFNNFEVILVDDGSPDSCPEICDDYARNYSNVKVIHKPNGGLSDARNYGLVSALGTYVTFVDSDDFWNDSKVLTGVSEVIFKNNFPDVIVSDFIKYYENGNKYINPPFVSQIKMNGSPKILMLEYLYFCQADMKMSACQKFAKRELLTEIPFTKGLLSEDIDWSLKLYPKVSSICVYDKPYYCYRQGREGSITNTASQRSFDCLIQILDKWSTQLLNLDLSNDERDIYLGYLAYQLSIAIMLLLNTDYSNRKSNLKALKKHLHLFNYPSNFKTKKVKWFVKLFGINLTARALKLYTKCR